MWDRAEGQITVSFIRHGETRANQERRYLGRTDERLSKEGRKALLAYKSQKVYPDVEQVFSSPMERCLETAGILYPKMCPMVIPEWEEMDFGCFENKNYQELKGDAAYQAWIDSNGMLPFPEGESRKEFCQRCEKGFWRMLQMLYRASEDAFPGEIREKATVLPYISKASEGIFPRKRRVGAIVHGGTIMALISKYGGGDYFDYQAANGRGYLCRVKIVGKELAEQILPDGKGDLCMGKIVGKELAEQILPDGKGDLCMEDEVGGIAQLEVLGRI